MLLAIKHILDVDISALAFVYDQTIKANGKDRRFSANTHEDQQVFIDDLRDFLKIPDSNLFVWVADDRYVSAVRLEPFQDGVLISYLETAPTERGKGYGRTLVKESIDCLVGQGIQRIYSHVGKKNKPSLRIHLDNGFQIHEEYAKLLDGTVSQNYYTLVYKNTAG